MRARQRHFPFSAKATNASLGLFSPAITGKSNNDLIDSWSDLSGNTNNATGTGAQRPTYKTNSLKGWPVVSFDGISNRLTGGKIANISTTNTFIGVGKITGGGWPPKNIGVFFEAYSGATDYFAPYFVNGTNWRLYNGGNLDATALFGNGTHAILRAISNSTSSVIAVNGASNTGDAGNLDSNSSNAYALASWVGGSQFHQWDIAYCFVWGGTILSSSMIRRIEMSNSLLFGLKYL